MRKQLKNFLEELVSVYLGNSPIIETMSGQVSPRHVSKLLHIVNEALLNIYTILPIMKEVYYIEYDGNVVYEVNVPNLIRIDSITTESGCAIGINDPLSDYNANILHYNVIEIPQISQLKAVRVSCSVYPKIDYDTIEEISEIYSQLRIFPTEKKFEIDLPPIIETLVKLKTVIIYLNSIGGREQITKSNQFEQQLNIKIAEINRDNLLNQSSGMSINPFVLNDLP